MIKFINLAPGFREKRVYFFRLTSHKREPLQLNTAGKRGGLMKFFLGIQLANRAGLLPRINLVREYYHGPADLPGEEERVAFGREQFRAS
jgi:hypothetical protein